MKILSVLSKYSISEIVLMVAHGDTLYAYNYMIYMYVTYKCSLQL